MLQQVLLQILVAVVLGSRLAIDKMEGCGVGRESIRIMSKEVAHSQCLHADPLHAVFCASSIAALARKHFDVHKVQGWERIIVSLGFSNATCKCMNC